MSAFSPKFRLITDMLQVSKDRLEAVEDNEASRLWCRQRQGLMVAMIAEPPVTLADAMALLAVLSEWRDLIGSQGEDMAASERLALDEMTTIALANCNICLADAEPHDAQFTVDHVETIGWLQRKSERWLPMAGVVA